MKESPCDDKCPVYAICQHRDAVGKYEICPKFREAVTDTMKQSQEWIDKDKKGRGKITVVGVRIDGKGPMIDKDGNKISD